MLQFESIMISIIIINIMVSGSETMVNNLQDVDKMPKNTQNIV